MITKHQHLSEEEIAVCAEAANKGDISAIAAGLSKHLHECDECAHAVLQVSETVHNLHEIKQRNVNLKLALLKRTIPVAASIALVLSAAYFINFLILSDKNGIDEPLVQSAKDAKDSNGLSGVYKVDSDAGISLSGNSDNLQFAYIPNEKLEKICQRYIGSAMRDTEILVHSPAMIESCDKSIELRWDNKNRTCLIIELYDNTGQLISEIQTTNSSFEVDNISSPGLYYWKLLNEDFDLLFCGKICIKQHL